MASGSTVYIDANAYFDSGWKYITSAAASNYYQSSGAHIWQNAASGTAGNAISFTQAMVLDASGNLGIGTTSPVSQLEVKLTTNNTALTVTSGFEASLQLVNGGGSEVSVINAGGSNILSLRTANTERARIDSSGNLLVGTTGTTTAAKGAQLRADGTVIAVVDGGAPLILNRLTDDGELVSLQQGTVQEGSISVSGSTVSYNGGHLSRWAQTTTTKDDSIVKGTVLSNLDAMNLYTDSEGNPVDNEQLNKVKVSDTEGDVNVAGVFVNWTHDDAHNVDEINMAMTGDMIIRIAQGVTVVRGELLMSAGDGTAKPQGDDIVRSKTVAKVTSNHITCTYADGSYCVPCVLMAC
jgi:hypothetical protein